MTGEKSLFEKMKNYLFGDIDIDKSSLIVQAGKRIYDLFTFENENGVGSDSPVNDEFDSMYLFDYKGKPIYAVSEESLKEILDTYGDDDNKSGDVNYGAALDGTIYVNEKYVRDVLDKGRADYSMNIKNLKYVLESEDFKMHNHPEAMKKLKYIIDHENSHIDEDSDEIEAHKAAIKKTGYKFPGLEEIEAALPKAA